MKRTSEQKDVERKRPVRDRLDLKFKKVSGRVASDKIEQLRRKLAEARLKNAPSSVIRMIRRQIEMLRHSERPRMFSGKTAYSSKDLGSGSGRLFRKRLVKPPVAASSGVEVISLADVRARRHFVPQAIVSEPVKTFADRQATSVVEDADAFDQFEGVAFAMDGQPFTVMHYREHPDHTATIYLPKDISDVDQITASIAKIVDRFGLPRSAVIWQRRDDPDL